MLINASAASILLSNKSVHAICTSPPYYALRKYEGDQGIEWPEVIYSLYPGLPPITIPAMKAPLGLEKTPEAYIGHMILICRELYRVLRDDGVFWLCMGDSFASPSKGNLKGQDKSGLTSTRTQEQSPTGLNKLANSGLKQGNLMMIPHRLALALQGDGWLVRNDNVWGKLNCTPESVRGWRWVRHRIKIERGKGKRSGTGNPTIDGFNERYFNPEEHATKYVDCPGCPKCEPSNGYILQRGSWRHTRSHEYVFMLSKFMQYWSDQEVVREPLARPEERHRKTPAVFGGANKHHGSQVRRHSGREYRAELPGRNPRSVFHLPTACYKGAHYAVYPDRLIRSLIKSSCPAKCCPECGKGWSPIVEKKIGISKECPKTQVAHEARGGTGTPTGTVGKSGSGRTDGYTIVTGYKPTCNCGHENFVAGTVFDPFVGSGTTAVVAIEEGLNWIGCDLSFEYLKEQACNRLNNVQIKLKGC